MSKSFLFLIIFSALNAEASFLICEIVEKPDADTVKIEYQDSNPHRILMKSSESQQFAEADVEIDPVLKNEKTGLETFNIKPLVDVEIDWSNEKNCYVRYGTQWYFNLNHITNEDKVVFYPFYIKEFESCRTPRHRPQNYRLTCDRQDF